MHGHVSGGSGGWDRRGAVLVTVLVCVLFVSIVVIACVTLITVASRTLMWSEGRTRALYAAEAGIDHWLFEAAIELSDADHGSRHGQGGGGPGHGHAYGHSKGKGPWEDGSSDLATLQVSGEANGIDYFAYVDSFSAGDGTYSLVSVADYHPRDLAVSVSARESIDAWRHVLYAREVNPELAEALWDAAGVLACDLSGMNPSAGESRPFLWDGTGADPIPIPIWESYRAAVASQLDGWDWPDEVDAKNTNLGPVFTPAGSPPFYYRKVTAGTIRGPVDGDLYLEDCTVGRLEGPVNGSIYVESSAVEEIAGPIGGSVFVRSLKADTGVERITGAIDGSVGVQCREKTKGGGKSGSYELVQLGGSDERISVGGSVYVAGRVMHKAGEDYLPVVLRLAGPEDSPSVVAGGVFAQDASAYVLGSVEVSRNATLRWPAILSRGAIVLAGGGSISISGPAYAEAGSVHALDEIIEDALKEAGWAEGSAREFAGVVTWPGLAECNPGLLVVGPPDPAYSGDLALNGNVVSPGMPIITTSFSVEYDEALLDPGKQPPYFTGGRRALVLVEGTWSMTMADGAE